MVVIVKMNNKEIARFYDSPTTGRTAEEQAKAYLASLSKVYPKAKIVI